MQSWRLILIIALIIVLIPTVILMNQVEKGGKSDSAERQKKQKMLKWCTRLLIAIFLVTLVISMYQHYGALLNA